MRRGLSLLFASLCLLMLALGASPAQAADSIQCYPPDRSFTVAPGGSETINLQACSSFGLNGSSQTPQHGALLNFNPGTGNGTGIVTYKNNNDGATSDFFILLDDMNREIRFTVTITSAPDAPTISAATAGNAQASVYFTAPVNNGGSTITGYTVTASPGNFTGSGASSPITVTGLTNNTPYTFTVTATNAIGTSSPSAASNSVTPRAAPVISAISPNRGSSWGSTAITITGSGFSGATSLKFGATSAAFTVRSDTQITATSPAGIGTVDVRVTTPGGTSATSTAGQFTYIAAPVVSSISPSTGSTSGGTSVVIRGSDFTGESAVTFGSTAAISYTINSATQITATSPAGTGTVDVRVTTPGGTSATSTADQFTYVPGPAVSGVSPNSGPATGGTSVTVTGTGFTGATSVTVGGVPATGITVVSSTQITLTSPAGAGTVDVQVTTAGGTSPVNAADQFTYIPTPVVSSLSPASGPTSGGTTVTINGTDLLSAKVVTFGSTPAASFTINSATQITATSPAGTGTVDVRVTTAGGTSATSAASPFIYAADVAVGAVSATVAYGSSNNTIALDLKGGSPTSVAVASNPAHGSATASGTEITYTPTAGYAGTDSFTYSATKGGITSAPATVSITVSPPIQTVTPSGAWSATRGVFYTQTLTWSGGTAPYTNYAVLNLPDGLSLSNQTATSFVISGIPIQAGSFSITASAKDSSTGDGPFTHSATFTLTVSAASPLALAPGATAFSATFGSAFSQTFTASGGLAPYTFTQSGALPAGVTWNAGTATLSGEPTESGDFAFSITASDNSAGAPETFTQSYTLRVTNQIPVAPAQSVNSAGPGEPVVVNLTSNATGGPFTGANLISIVPANAGTATISAVGAGAARMRMLAAAPGNNYSLQFVPNPDASGLVTLTYTLSNATSTSIPGVITISLSSRSDPSKDAEVQGLINAQANSSRRFASGQISNFQQRLEALHAGNVSSFSNGFTLTSTSLQRQRQRQSLTDDPTGIEQWMQIQSAKLQSDQSLRLNPSNKLTNTPTQGLKTSSASQLPPELGNQSADAPTSPLAFWTSGTISIGDDSRGKSGQSQEFVTSGLSVGADYRLAPNLTVGLGFGYGYDKTDIGDNGSRSQADSYSLALYGSYRPVENIYLDGVLGYQRLSFDNRRYVTDNAGMVNGNRDGSQVFLSLAAGYEYRQENWMLSPYARLDLANATLDKYRERGNEMFALSYDEQKVKTTSTSLGLRSEYAQSTGIGIFTPSLRVEYQHDFQGAGDAAMRYANVTGDGALYHVKLDALGQDRGVFGLGLGLLTESNLSLNIEYQYTLSSGAQKAQSMLFNLRKPF